MKVFTRESAAEIIGVGKKLLDEYREKGLLPFSKVGRLVRIKESSLFALFDATSFRPRTLSATRGELKVFDNEGAEKFLQLSSSTIIRRRRDGLLNFSKIGDRVLFLEEDFHTLLDVTSSTTTGGKI